MPPAAPLPSLLLLLVASALLPSAQAQAQAPSALALALEQAREDVLDHVREVESHIRFSLPPPGSLGEYMLDNKVFHKAAIFGIFNTTFLNTDLGPNATDTEFELVFQGTGVNKRADGHPVPLGEGAGLNGDMWLRDSGAQMHYYVANGLAASSPALTRVLQALLREHARYTLLDSYANSFSGTPFQSSSRVMRCRACCTRPV